MSQPEIALFESLALGFWIGSFKVGPLQLGGVCGTLIVALVLGQSGARISPDLKNIAFALFIFALGFTGGPLFFSNGLVTIVIFTSQIAPLLLRVNLRDEGKRLWRSLGGDGALEEGQSPAAPSLIGREVLVEGAAGVSVAELEAQHGQQVSVHRVTRERIVIKAVPSLVLKNGDRILLAGRREALLNALPNIGIETAANGLADVYAQKLDVMLTRREVDGLSVAQVRALSNPVDAHGVYIAAVTRLDSTIPALPATTLHRGDVLTLVGPSENVTGAASKLGYILRATQKTDFVLSRAGRFGWYCVGTIERFVGRGQHLSGHWRQRLISGLMFGWIRSRYPVVGSLPSAAAQILKDFGLCPFIAAVVDLRCSRHTA